MAQTDWGTLANSLDASNVKRGVTTGPARPLGGGAFVFGFNSVTNADGAVGLYASQVGFAPMSKGMSIRGAMKRAPSGGPTNFSPFLFGCLSSNDVSGVGYLLGLDDDDPSRIVLVKGPVTAGVIAGAVGTTVGSTFIAKQGSDQFLNDTWVHLRLDVIVNTNGDVIVQAFKSDVTINPVTAPVWVAVPGCEQFVDDALSVNSGTAPLTSGYGGFGFRTKDITRRAWFDQLEVQKQQ